MRAGAGGTAGPDGVKVEVKMVGKTETGGDDSEEMGRSRYKGVENKDVIEREEERGGIRSSIFIFLLLGSSGVFSPTLHSSPPSVCSLALHPSCDVQRVLPSARRRSLPQATRPLLHVSTRTPPYGSNKSRLIIIDINRLKILKQKLICPRCVLPSPAPRVLADGPRPAGSVERQRRAAQVS